MNDQILNARLRIYDRVIEDIDAFMADSAALFFLSPNVESRRARARIDGRITDIIIHRECYRRDASGQLVDVPMRWNECDHAADLAGMEAR